MTTLHALLIALIQGVTELFPVSSLGHAVIIPAILGWGIDQHAPDFLPFLVVLHLGTATALLIYFWRDWMGIAAVLLGKGTPENRRLVVRIVAATLPAVVVGFALEKALRHLFGAPVVAAAFLVANGLMLFFGERLRRSNTDRRLADMSIKDAVLIGVWQCAALFPGISRSGATMVGGLLTGLHHEDAAHFSFLIALPIIVGAGVLEVPKMIHSGAVSELGGLAVVTGIVAGIAAYISTWALMRYFHRHDFHALNPFGWYCCVAGGLALVTLAL